MARNTYMHTHSLFLILCASSVCIHWHFYCRTHMYIHTFPLRRFSRVSYHIAPFMRHFATELNASVFNNGAQQQQHEQEQLCMYAHISVCV